MRCEERGRGACVARKEAEALALWGKRQRRLRCGERGRGACAVGKEAEAIAGSRNPRTHVRGSPAEAEQSSGTDVPAQRAASALAKDVSPELCLRDRFPATLLPSSPSAYAISCDRRAPDVSPGVLASRNRLCFFLRSGQLGVADASPMTDVCETLGAVTAVRTRHDGRGGCATTPAVR